MTAEQFLIQQWNKCISVVNDDEPSNIIMFYDKHHERKLKLNSLDNTNKYIKFIETNYTKVLFYQKHTSGYLYVNYDDIWLVLNNEYNLSFDEVFDLINKTILVDYELIPRVSKDMPMNKYYSDILNNEKTKQI